MSADTTGAKVESSTENVDQQQSEERKPQAFHHQGGGGGGGGSGGGGRGGRGGRFQNRRQNQNQGKDFDRKGGRFQKGGSGGQGDHRPLSERIMYERLNEISGPSFDLPAIDSTEKKFSNRNRLYVGNIPNELEESELQELFNEYGETRDLFINKEKNFGFIKLDYHFNAEKAKNDLNGKSIKNRSLKVRFAPFSASVRVKNLDEYVTNELLQAAFSIFGEIERCVVIADDRGKSIGEGVVEFARKPSAQLAIRKCTEDCFFLTANLRPVIVEAYEPQDDCDGYSEKFVKKNPEFFKQRNVGPRFGAPNSFEEEYGMHWKQLNDLYQQKLLALKKENEIEQEKLVAQMEFARYEHETAMLRKQLRDREMDMDRQKREWEIREQQAEENRRRTEEQMRRQEEELQSRIIHQEEEMRRRQQENSLFMQAQQLDNMLNSQEENFNNRNDMGSNSSDNKPFMGSGDYRNYDSRDDGPNMGGGRGHRGRGQWSNDRDYQAKRRRY
nr:hrp65 protein-like [Onthophagus taurus]